MNLLGKHKVSLLSMLVVATSAISAPYASADTPTITVTALGLAPGDTGGGAQVINERGQIAGNSGSHAVTWDSGQLTELGNGVPSAINIRGEVVGNETVEVDGTYPGFPIPVPLPISQARYWANGETVQLLPDNAGSSNALDINALGQVLASFDSDAPVYPEKSPDKLGVWRAGHFTELALPGPVDHIRGAVINNLGVVAGSTFTGAFKCVRGTCASLPGVTDDSWYYVKAINALGQVAGTVQTPRGLNAEAVVWSGNRMIRLGTLGGGESDAADGHQAINVRGDVVGQSTTASGQRHAFLWRNGRMIDLGTLGGDYSYAKAVNDRGDVIGYSGTADGEGHAFLWRDGHMIDLGGVSPGQATPYAINNRGQIVGSSGATVFTSVRPTLWTVR
jgi:probable HAF family extracellular repeat protein